MLFIGAAAIAGACQSLVGIEDSPPAPSVGGDASLGGAAGASGGTSGSAGVSGAAGSGGAADAGCNLAHPPAATAGADPGGNIDFVVAVRTIELGDTVSSSGAAWTKLGYDLDKLCTCSTDQLGSCKPPKQVVCDGVDGRDNALGAFVHQVGTVFKIGDLSSAKLTTKIEGGGNTVLIRVRGYNGSQNDGQVEVTWFASDDFPVSNTAPPKWDGTDEWPVLSSSLEPLTPDGGADAGADSGKDATASDAGSALSVEYGKYVDKLAYVANGTLVANLPAGSFSLTAATSLNFAAALFTAKIENAPGGGWALQEGVLAGITKVSDVLGVLPSMDDPFLGLPICTDSLIYAGIKSVICDFPDMTILGTPAKPCDYMSLGINVTGHPAKLGAISVKPDKPSKCAPGTDPSLDSC